MPENELPLPEKIPPRWLDQITEVVKSQRRGIWLEFILTSSVMAALIGAGASYYTTKATIAANEKLEQIKTRLELAKDNVRSKVAAYEKLSQNLNTFTERLEGFANLIEIAGRGRLTPRLAAHIRQELKGIGLSEGKMNDAKNDSLLNGTHARERVDECLQQLNPALAKARSDPSASLVPIRSAIGLLRDINPEIQHSISNEISSIK